MLESTSSLPQMENILEKQMEEITFLGQMHLTRHDFTKLEDLVKRKLTKDISFGTTYMEKECPVSFATFLVWEGIYKYREGNYWSAIEDVLGVDISCWRTRWGEFFLDFLHKYELPSVKIEGSRRYVTPILLHAGIPLNCTDSFFQYMVWPLVKDRLTDAKAIKAELQTIRNEYQNWVKLSSELKNLESVVDTLKQSLKRMIARENILELRMQLEKAKEFIETNDAAGNISLDVIQKRTDLLIKLQKKSELIPDLKQEKKHIQRQIKEIGDKSRLIKTKELLAEFSAVQHKVDTCKKALAEVSNGIKLKFESLFNQEWQWEYASKIKNIPSDKLRELVGQLAEVEDNLCKLKEQKETEKQKDRFLGKRIIALTAAFLLGIIGVLAESPVLWLLTVGLLLYVSNIVRKNNQNKSDFLKLKIQENEERRASIIEKIDKLVPFNSKVDVYQLSLDSLSEEIINLQAMLQEKMKLDDEYNTLHQKRLQLIASLEEMGLDIAENAAPPVFQELIKDLDAKLNKWEHLSGKLAAVQKKMEHTYKQQSAIEKGVNSIDKKLAELGTGSVERGINIVNKFWETVSRKKDIEKQLENYYYDWPGLKSETDEERDLLRAFEHSKAKSKDLQQELAQTEVLLSEKEKELKTYFPVLQQVEEPVKRFLVDGGETSQKQLMACISILDKANKSGALPKLADYDLPPHIKEALNGWWEAQSVPPQLASSKEPEFSSPACYLEPVTAEIYLHFPAQRLTEPPCSEQAFLKLIGAEDKPLNEVPLRLFRNHEHYLYTEAIDIELTAPVEIMKLIMTDEEKTLYYWQRSGINQYQPYLIFNYDTNRQVTDRFLPRKTLWLVIPVSASIEPQIPIFEEITFYGEWDGYKGLAVNLENEELTGIKIVNDGETYELFTASDAIVEPTLAAGNEVLGVTAREEKIHAGELPSIRFNCADKQQLLYWRINIHSLVRDYTYNFASGALVDAAIETIMDKKPVVEIKLNDLIQPKEIDLLQIYLRGPANKRYVFSFAWLAQLDYRYAQDLYFPVAYETDRVSLDILIPRQCTYTAYKPSEIIKTNGNLYRMMVGRSEDYVHGKVIDANGNYLDLAFRIPKIKWRLVGAGIDSYSHWSDTIQEIWIDDLRNAAELFLIVAVPSWLNGKGRLVLGDGLQEDIAPINKGIIKFDLLKFSDSLLIQKSLKQSFMLTLNTANGSYADIELFRVKTKWLIQNLRFATDFTSNELILDFTWDDVGQPLNRVLEICDLLEDKERTFSQPINDGSSTVKVKLKRDMVPPSLYLIQFFIDDPWSSTAKKIENENRFIVFITDRETANLETCSIKWQNHHMLRVEGKVNNAYSINSVYIVTLGTQNGAPACKVKTVTLNPETGKFECVVPTTKNATRWMAILSPKETSEGFWWVGLLEEATSLEIPIDDQVLQQADEFGEIGQLQIRLKSEKGRLSETRLEESISNAILEAVKQGKDTVGFSHVVEGSFQKVKLKKDVSGFKLCYDKGVVCTTCKRIFPNQTAWFEHNPRQKCKGLEINVKEIGVKAFIVWDSQKLQQILPQQIYPRDKNFKGIKYLLVNGSTNNQMSIPDTAKNLYRVINEQSTDAAWTAVLSLWRHELAIGKLL